VLAQIHVMSLQSKDVEPFPWFRITGSDGLASPSVSAVVQQSEAHREWLIQCLVVPSQSLKVAQVGVQAKAPSLPHRRQPTATRTGPPSIPTVWYGLQSPSVGFKVLFPECSDVDSSRERRPSWSS
jgi:hypothetical protein